MLTYATSTGKRGEISGDCSLELNSGESIGFDLSSGGHWFGHGFSHMQPYPLERGTIVAETFAVCAGNGGVA
jgi:hypothetical protein